MMINVMIPFEVEPNSISVVKKAIHDFIKEIKKNESGTLMYKSFQEADTPVKFVHVMTFVDKNAQEYHRQTPHCKAFVEKLYPLCTQAPQATLYLEIE